MKTLSTLIVACVLAITGTANAQYYYRHRPPPWIEPKPIGGVFGVSGFGTIVARQDGGVEYMHSGGGLSIWGGVEIGRVVGIEAKYSASFHNPIDSCAAGPRYSWCDVNFLLLESFGINLKLHIPTRTRFVPFFVVGPEVAWIGRTGGLADAVGGGFEVGGGFDVWFNRHGTVGTQALYRGIYMEDYATFTGTATYLSLVEIGAQIAAHF